MGTGQSTKFKDLSVQECLRVYPAVAANAQEFYRSAELLATDGIYGKAISMLILGAEEYVKTLCLLLDAYGCNTRAIPGMSDIFFRHPPRHRLSRDFLTVWVVLKEFLAITTSTDVKSGLGQLGKALFKIMLAPAEIKWWQDADRLKQKGFYADYTDQLWIPVALVKSDYEKAWGYAREIPVVFNKLKNHLSGLDDLQLKEFINDFDKAGFASLIEEALQRKK